MRNLLCKDEAGSSPCALWYAWCSS